jgi:hypothetical protein
MARAPVNLELFDRKLRESFNMELEISHPGWPPPPWWAFLRRRRWQRQALRYLCLRAWAEHMTPMAKLLPLPPPR